MPSYLPKTGADTVAQGAIGAGATARVALTAVQTGDIAIGGERYSQFFIFNLGSDGPIHVRPVTQAEVDAVAPVLINATYTMIPQGAAFEWRRRADEVALDILNAAPLGTTVAVVAVLPTGDK